MSSFNKVMLMGNLTRDPEVRYTPNGAAICNLGLAVNRKFKAQDGSLKDETTFVDVTVFGKQGESCRTYLTKGSPVFIEGRLRFEQWTDKNTGQNRSRLTVTGENVTFLPKNNGGQQQGGDYGGNSYGAPQGGYQQQSAPQQQAAPQQPAYQAPPASQPQQSAPQQQQAAPASYQPPPMPDFNEDIEDDIPF